MANILFSLPNGAELIGKVVEETTEAYTIDQPLAIRPVQKVPGQFVLDLFPHSLTNPEGKHKFSKSQLLSISLEIPDMLEKAYNERTSSIIINGAVDAFANLIQK
jgi:hypothetical protein